jgi:protein phosphatase
MALKLSAFGLSDLGKVRSRNEDSLCVEPSRGIAVVADGMGGAPAGDVASALAVQEVARGLHGGGEMEEVIRRANDRIFEMAGRHSRFSGMGTTVTALRVRVEEETWTVGHVGDSRAYRFDNRGLHPVTRDHTVVRRMVEEGTLSMDQERNHPMSHILSQALGTQETVEVDVHEGRCGEGEGFLLCSDGLIAVMPEEEMEIRVERALSGDPEVVVKEMVEEANGRGAPDNVTVAIVTWMSRSSSS